MKGTNPPTVSFYDRFTEVRYSVRSIDECRDYADRRLYELVMDHWPEPVMLGSVLGEPAMLAGRKAEPVRY